MTVFARLRSNPRGFDQERHSFRLGKRRVRRTESSSRGRRPTIEILEARTLLAASLVRDINRTGFGGDPDELARSGGVVFFRADNRVNGEELWKTDGTTLGTVMVRDIHPNGSSSPRAITNAGGNVFFVADDGISGDELWFSDGTSQGTRLVKDIFPGAGSSFISEIVNVGTSVFFNAEDDVNGFELWRSDGTVQGTVLVRDIAPGLSQFGSPESSFPRSLLNVGGTIFFVANDGVTGSELWRSNGTSAGTVLVADINPDGDSVSTSSLASLGSTVFFAADDGVNGSELWKSDGTQNGTMLVADIDASGPGSGSFPQFLTNVNGTLFFSAFEQSTGVELYKSDGTLTELVADISPGLLSSSPTRLTNLNGSLIFSASDGMNGTELWRSNGTDATTTMVFDINPGPSGGLEIDFMEFFARLTVVGTNVFFSATDDSLGAELWRSDGTTPGTMLVRDIRPGAIGSEPLEITALGSQAIFSADSGSGGRELFGSDGLFANTSLIRDIGTGNESSAVSDELATLGDARLFVADDGISGPELWKADGSNTGTVLVKDIFPGFSGSSPRDLTVVGNTVFFVADDGVSGSELWRSDGTEAGTMLVADLEPGSFGTFPFGLTDFNGTLVFAACVGFDGCELYRSDGTAIGTSRIKEINPSGSGIDFFVSPGVFNNVLLFAASDGVTGTELWRSDGTEIGTFLLADIAANELSSFPTGFVSTGQTAFFAANNEIVGRELWATDGTTQGTRLVRDILAGAEGGLFIFGGESSLTVVEDSVVFGATDGISGLEPWISDGTNGGTRMVADIRPGPRGSLELPFFDAKPAVLGSTVVFPADDGVRGIELWKSDGTVVGTQIVRDIFVGRGDGLGISNSFVSSGRLELTLLDERVYFVATDGNTGRELWRTDGTTVGTTPTDDIIPGPVGSEPTGFGVAGGTLFFNALAPNIGEELFKFTVPLFVRAVADDQPETLTLVRETNRLTVLSTAGGVTSRILENIDGGVVLAGAVGDDDAFFLDFDTGDLGVAGPITVIGGPGGNDRLDVTGGVFNTVTYGPTGPNDGLIAFDGTQVFFRGLEPILDNSSATNRVFTLGAVVATTVRIGDDGIFENGLSLIDSNGTNGFESIVFANPSSSLTVNGGPFGETFIIESVDIAATFATTVAGGGGPDIFFTRQIVGGTFRLDGGGGIDLVVADDEDRITITDQLLTIGGGGGGPAAGGGGFPTTLFDLASFEQARLNSGSFDSRLDSTQFRGMATLSGGDGADTLVSGPANDVLIGGAGDDFMSGGRGGDTYRFAPTEFAEVDTVDEGVAPDTAPFDRLDFKSLSASESVTVNLTVDAPIAQHRGRVVNTAAAGQATNFEAALGGAGDDTLIGNVGPNELEGGPGVDSIDGGDGRDCLVAEFDDDITLMPMQVFVGGRLTQRFGGIEDVRLIGGPSPNRINAATFTLPTTLEGGGGRDTITGGTDNDSIMGGEDDDVLTGGPGNDILDGGVDGEDVLVEAADTDFLLTDTSLSGLGEDSITGFEEVRLTLTEPTGGAIASRVGGGSGSRSINAAGFGGKTVLIGNSDANLMTGGSGADNIQGLGGADTIGGGTGADTQAGGDGDDVFVAGDGDDSFSGDAGNDALDFSAASSAITVDLASGSSTGNGTDTIALIEIIIGTSQNDVITGTDAIDSIFGGAGNDTLRGGLGNDTLDGGDGDDRLIGQGGDDRVLGRAGNDFIKSGGGADTVRGGGGADTVSAGGGNDVVLGQAGADSIRGGGGADSLSGFSGDDTIDGEAGNDTILGGNGNDSILGGAEIDQLFGDAGFDQIIRDALDTIFDTGADGGDITFV